jgi:CHAT domain-containing protein
LSARRTRRASDQTRQAIQIIALIGYYDAGYYSSAYAHKGNILDMLLEKKGSPAVEEPLAGMAVADSLAQLGRTNESLTVWRSLNQRFTPKVLARCDPAVRLRYYMSFAGAASNAGQPAAALGSVLEAEQLFQKESLWGVEKLYYQLIGARLRLANNEYEAAETAVRKIIKDLAAWDPRGRGALLGSAGVDDVRIGCQLLLGDIAFAQGSFDDSLAEYKECWNLRPPATEPAGEPEYFEYAKYLGKRVQQAQWGSRQEQGLVAARRGVAKSLLALHRGAEAAQFVEAIEQFAWDFLSANLLALTAEERSRVMTALLGDLPPAYSLVRGDDREAAGISYSSVLWRKALAFDAMRNVHVHREQRLSGPELELRNKHIAAERSLATAQLYQLLNGAPGHSFLQSLDPRQMEAMRDQAEALAKQVAGFDAEYASRKRMPEVSFKEVAARLRYRDVLLEYVRYRTDGTPQGAVRYKVFILQGTSDEVVAIELGMAEGPGGIDRLVAEFHEKASSFASTAAEVAVASAKLYRAVVEPIAQVVDLEKKTRLYIAPDGPLANVPFEGLVTPGGNHRIEYLIERHEIVYLVSSRDLVALTTQPKSAFTRTATLIGDPVINRTHSPSGDDVIAKLRAGLTDLTETRQFLGADESEGLQSAIRQKDMDCKLLVGLAATEAAISSIEPSRIIAFATHGIFLQATNPSQVNPLLRSMLVLTSAPLTEERNELAAPTTRPTDDGLLTAYEVTALDLGATELVALIACQSGRGDVQLAEALTGLRHAFLSAGARSVIVSLWDVELSTTLDQMLAFFGSYWGQNGAIRYGAFRDSQLTRLRAARGQWHGGAPAYWAGFIFVGDPGDLPRESN